VRETDEDRRVGATRQSLLKIVSVELRRQRERNFAVHDEQCLDVNLARVQGGFFTCTEELRHITAARLPVAISLSSSLSDESGALCAARFCLCTAVPWTV
jgi:hypothetical protein